MNIDKGRLAQTFFFITVLFVVVFANIAACYFVNFINIFPSDRETLVALDGSDKYSIQARDITGLWYRDNVYFDASGLGPSLAASTDSVFVSGRLSQDDATALLTFDSSNGALLWSRPSQEVVSNVATDSIFLISNGPNVEAYASDTGVLLWKFHIPRFEIAFQVYLAVENIHVRTGHALYTLSPQTGELISSYENTGIRGPVVETEETLYVQTSGEELQAIDRNSGKELWKAYVVEGFNRAPVFTENHIFIRTGNNIGNIYAIDKAEGVILWKTRENIVSNVVATDFSVFALTQAGGLVRLDPTDGSRQTMVRFFPSSLPLQVSTFLPEYYIATNSNQDKLFVLLGDRAQLLVFGVDD